MEIDKTTVDGRGPAFTPWLSEADVGSSTSLQAQKNDLIRALLKPRW